MELTAQEHQFYQQLAELETKFNLPKPLHSYFRINYTENMLEFYEPVILPIGAFDGLNLLYAQIFKGQ